jgi:hypothetical protein
MIAYQIQSIRVFVVSKEIENIFLTFESKVVFFTKVLQPKNNFIQFKLEYYSFNFKLKIFNANKINRLIVVVK